MSDNDRNVPAPSKFGFVIHILTLNFFFLKVKELDSPVINRQHTIDTYVPSHAIAT